MAKKPLLFVDTNIFLDFYRTEGHPGLTLLKHVESVAELLIMTEQVEAEFLSNRQRVISAALADIKVPTIPDFIPAYLADSNAAAALERDIDRLGKRIKLMKERFAGILNDPGRNDPVYKSFRRIVDNSFNNFNLGNLEKRKQIFDSALQRHQKGFPPRKKDSNSIGDAINWEWILNSARTQGTDALIVSRDGDYGSLKGDAYLNDWLSQEFKQKVSKKRKAEITPSLSQALKRLDINVTPAEEKEEQNIVASKFKIIATRKLAPVPPNFWETVLEQVSKSNKFLYSYLREAHGMLLEDGTMMISVPPESRDHLGLIDNDRTAALLTKVVSDLGYKMTGRCEFTIDLLAGGESADFGSPPPFR